MRRRAAALGALMHRFYPAVAQLLARSLAGPLATASLDAAERAA